MRRYNKPEKNPSKTLMIIAIGAVMMVLLDFSNTELHKRKALKRLQQQAQSEAAVDRGSEAKATAASKKTRTLDDILSPIFTDIPHPEPVENEFPEPMETKEEPPSPPEQTWKDNAVPAEIPDKKTKVVIIIDDMGMDRKHSNQIIDIDAPLTLAFLPYAPKLDEITSRAREQGHELLIHMPMEAMNPDANTGPIALHDDMSSEQVAEQLEQAFNSFEGYIGINNHMGSRVTQNEPIMNQVMSTLAKRGLVFVDSKTIQSSVAADTAAKHGLDYAERDVFLDHESTIGYVRNALIKLEKLSRAKGSAIAIGHPKAATIQGLKEWIPTLEQKGIIVVPVSNVLKNGFLEQGELAMEAIADEPVTQSTAEQRPETRIETLMEPAAGSAADIEKSEDGGLTIKPFPTITFSQPDQSQRPRPE